MLQASPSPLLQLQGAAEDVGVVGTVMAENIVIGETEGLLHGMAVFFSTCNVYNCEFPAKHKIFLFALEKIFTNLQPPNYRVHQSVTDLYHKLCS